MPWKVSPLSVTRHIGELQAEAYLKTENKNNPLNSPNAIPYITTQALKRFIKPLNLTRASERLTASWSGFSASCGFLKIPITRGIEECHQVHEIDFDTRVREDGGFFNL